MTEKEIKELAREYINGCTKRAGFVILTESIINDFIDLFVAGFMKCLELNKENKWHKVADGDLPVESELWKNDPDNYRYEWFIVATVGKTHRALYSFAKKKWFIDYEEMMIGTSYFEPIAWCEFPKYTG